MENKKALLVDSDASSRELIRILLEHEGYQTVTTADSVEALELASATSPDLILIDLHSPQTEGYETAQKLRQNGRFSKLIVALTGRDLDTDPAQISAAGFTAYISKPVGLRRFHEHLLQLQSA